MDPIYRVQRRDAGAEPVARVERPRLLTPAEREQAKRERDRKRQAKDKTRRSPQGPSRGTDYRA
jgi:hypothetical protein